MPHLKGNDKSTCYFKSRSDKVGVYLWEGDRYHQVVAPFQNQVALVKQVQGQLKVEDGAVAPRWQVAAELAKEQLVGSRTRWRSDVSRHLCAAVYPVMDVVTQVGS